jgi:hypothetical protein
VADLEVLDFQKGMVKMEREGHDMGVCTGELGFRVWLETLTLDPASRIDVGRLETTCLSVSLSLSGCVQCCIVYTFYWIF